MVWHGVISLRVEFSTVSDSTDAESVDDIQVTIDGHTIELTRSEATALRSELAAAITDHVSFLRTEGVHRSDGRYEVRRRTADSTGNSTIFEAFTELRSQYRSLPTTFGAADIEAFGVTGSRRHMVVWHFIEHPAFTCRLQSRNPLRATKHPDPPD